MSRRSGWFEAAKPQRLAAFRSKQRLKRRKEDLSHSDIGVRDKERGGKSGGKIRTSACYSGSKFSPWSSLESGEKRTTKCTKPTERRKEGDERQMEKTDKRSRTERQEQVKERNGERDRRRTRTRR